jgi:hypothetical protein
MADFRLGRLQGRVCGGPRPGWEGLAEVTIMGILGGGRQALPVGKLLGDHAVRGG